MRLNELLGIEFPFIQGGMANIATAEFAAAVSNAGALGLIGAGGMSPEVFQDSIRRCRTLTEKPFGVNIMLMHPQVEQLAAIAAQEKVAVVTPPGSSPPGRSPAPRCFPWSLPWPSPRSWPGPGRTPSSPRAPRAAAMWAS